MSIHSLSRNPLFQAFTKPVSREAEALLAGAVVGVALLTLAQSHDLSEYAEMPSDVTTEASEQQTPVRQHY